MNLRIPSLDGIRAISFLIVFIAHAGLEAVVPGGFGVTVFFFLSGYLITTLLRVEYQQHGHINLKHFWLRRALRILPPFYVVLLGATLLTLCVDFGVGVSGSALAGQLLHVTNYWIILHGYAGQPLGTGVYWSLAVEEHFYLLFPWLYIGMQKLRLSGRGQALLLWGLCLLILLWRCVLVLKLHVGTDRTYMASDTRVDSILFGCALAVWHNPVLDPAPARHERIWKWLLLPLALALLGGCLVYRGDAFRETLRYSLQGLALTVIFICAIRYEGWAAFRWLNHRVLVFVGTLSYALYLVHYTVIFAAAKAMPRAGAVAQGLVAFGASLLLAWLSYVYLEKPCARLRRKLSD